MSEILSRHQSNESEGVGAEQLDTSAAPHLSDFSIGLNNNKAALHYLSSDGSHDEDRPNSRLRIIESPSTSFEHEEELSQFSLDSPELEEDYYEELTSPGLPPGADHHLKTEPEHFHSHSGHQCEECFKSFTSPGKLRQHEYSHTGETPFECKIPGCDKKFTSKFKLKRHILIHSQTKTFLCDICQRAFRRKDHLKNHEKVHDPGKTVYTCTVEDCGRTYNSVSSFRKHQAMHSAEEGQLDCKICKMLLQTQEELMDHLKVHAGSRTVKGSVDKKFVCTQCEKKFFTRKDLKRHSVVHTGNREFSCPHCTQRFGRKDHMTRHAKKTHASYYENRPGGRTRLMSCASDQSVEQDLQDLQEMDELEELPPIRPGRKMRSVSDPGPKKMRGENDSPPLLSLIPSSSSNCQPVIEELQRLEFRQREESSVPQAQRQQVIVSHRSAYVPSPPVTSEAGLEADLAKQNNFIHIRQGPGLCKPALLVSKARPIHSEVNIDPVKSLTYEPSPVPTYPVRMPTLIHKPSQIQSFSGFYPGHGISDQTGTSQKTVTPAGENSELIQTAQFRSQPVLKQDLSQKENLHNLTRKVQGKSQQLNIEMVNYPKTLKTLVDQKTVPVTIKEENSCTDIYEDLREEDAIKELLAEKDRLDLTSFMNQFSEESLQNTKFRVYLDPPSPPMPDNYSLTTKLMDQGLIKVEPNTRPTSPMDSTTIQENFTADQQRYTGFDQQENAEHQGNLVIDNQLSQEEEEQKPRATFLRHPSQDYVTRTKNPVLPSIHAEAAMVVPDPNRLKYAVTRSNSEGVLHHLQPDNNCFPSPLDFGEEDEEEVGDLKTDHLTELRGSLFLTDDYPCYFQPWN